MTAPSLRRTAARCLALGLLIAVVPGCARDGLAKSGVNAQQDLQQALAAARTAEPHRTEPGAAESGAPESRIAENIARGHREAEAGRLDQAARFYERVLREDPSNPVAHHRLAVISDQNRDFAEAERHYAAALESRPNDPDLLNDLGYCYLLQGRYPESEKALRDAIAAAPTHERSLTNLGLLYGTIGDVDRALAVLCTTSSEAEARAKLAMLMPRSSSGPAASALAPGLNGQAPDAVLPVGAFSPQPAAAAAPSGRAAQSDAMRDLMAQLDQAKRDAATVRTAVSAPNRLPGLIDPEQATGSGTPLSASSQTPAQPYSRSDRHLHSAARPGVPLAAAPGADQAPSGLDRSISPAGSIPNVSGELPLWSPQMSATTPVQPPRGAVALPAETTHISAVASQPTAGPVQYATAEMPPDMGLVRRSGAHALPGTVTHLPPPAFDQAAMSDPGNGNARQAELGYGHVAASSPHVAQPYRPPYQEPGMQAYADDLARRDAEVAEMHRYMESQRRPAATVGVPESYGAPGGAAGYPAGLR